MNTTDDVLIWVELAEEDYALALLALRRKTPLTRGACFHAQQCAEKYMKAVLVARAHPFPKVHDLGTLAQLCMEAGFIFGTAQDDLARLTAYAVEVRYTGDHLSVDEARRALALAKSIRRSARRFLGLS